MPLTTNDAIKTYQSINQHTHTYIYKYVPHQTSWEKRHDNMPQRRKGQRSWCEERERERARELNEE